MHCLDILRRINAEWPHPLTHKERRHAAREAAIEHFERRLGVVVDRTDPMLGALVTVEMTMMQMAAKYWCDNA